MAEVNAYGSLSLTIEASEGGYTSPSVGTYYYSEQSGYVDIYAYPDTGHFLAGWIIDGEFENLGSPLSISLDNPTNETKTISPAFSTNPYYSIFFSCSLPVYIDVNNEQILCSTTGTEKIYPYGTTIRVYWSERENYIFNYFLINGETIITSPVFDFVLIGDNLITLDVTYTAPSLPLPDFPDDPPPTEPLISTEYFTLENLVSIIPSGLIISTIAFAFSSVGKTLDNHNHAGFLIGGSIGLLICTSQNLIPVWFTTLIIVCSSVLIYFWFKSGG